jgi:NAD(P)-dependent dehydrogenase (short-subunit alcohol dehydrogenase family)
MPATGLSRREQAAALVFLNSPSAAYINGTALPVDGGFSGGPATGSLDLAAMYQRRETN